MLVSLHLCVFLPKGNHLLGITGPSKFIRYRGDLNSKYQSQASFKPRDTREKKCRGTHYYASSHLFF